MVSELFKDKQANEFIIATIPTVLAMKESARLLQALRKESIPCHRMIVNQVSCTFLSLSSASEHASLIFQAYEIRCMQDLVDNVLQ